MDLYLSKYDMSSHNIFVYPENIFLMPNVLQNVQHQDDLITYVSLLCSSCDESTFLNTCEPLPLCPEFVSSEN